MTSEEHVPEDPVPGNVKRLREHRGLSQADLAAEMTAHGHRWFQNTIYRVEAGKQEVSLKEAVTLAAILGAQIADLTRPGPEAAEVVRVEHAHASLRRNWAAAATAVDGLATAREEAEKIASQAARSEHESVRKAGAALAADLERMTLASAAGTAEHPEAASALWRTRNP